MNETVETAVPIGISGLFLTRRKDFSEIDRLLSELYSKKEELQEVEVRLANCNQPAWLISFEKRYNRLNLDVKLELVFVAAGLESKKALLIAAIEVIRQQILELDPTALNPKTTLAGSFCPPLAPPARRRTLNDDVLSRNAVIDAHLDASDKDICTILDSQFAMDDRPARGIPETWIVDYNVRTFTEAYQRCPGLVHALISKRRGKRHLPRP